MRERNAVHDTYQRGGDGDPSKLVYRAMISDATRACTYGNGMTNMTIAVAGRVIPGPVGAVGTVQLPLQITIYRDNEVIDERTINHQVAISDTVGATQFMLPTPRFRCPMDQRNIRILIGFKQPVIRQTPAFPRIREMLLRERRRSRVFRPFRQCGSCQNPPNGG